MHQHLARHDPIEDSIPEAQVEDVALLEVNVGRVGSRPCLRFSDHRGADINPDRSACSDKGGQQSEHVACAAPDIENVQAGRRNKTSEECLG